MIYLNFKGNLINYFYLIYINFIYFKYLKNIFI